MKKMPKNQELATVVGRLLNYYMNGLRTAILMKP